MTTASKITLVRVLLIPAFMLLLSFGRNILWLRWLALGVYVIASVTDFIDGQVARRCGQVSNFGKFLDPLADKLLVLSAMVIFCEWGAFPAWALMLVLTREFAVTGLRLIAVEAGRVIAAGWSGKVKTFSTMVALGVMIIFYENAVIKWIAVALIAATTLYSGIEYFWKNRDVLSLK